MVRKTMRIWSNKIVVIVSLHKCSALSWLLDVLVDGGKTGYIYNKLVLCIWPVVSGLDHYLQMYQCYNILWPWTNLFSIVRLYERYLTSKYLWSITVMSYVISVCLRIVVSNGSCVVFLFCFSSSMLPVWLPLRYSLTFIWCDLTMYAFLLWL
jgi:hypothetical protein